MTVVANKRSVMTMYSDASSPYSHRVRLVLAEKNITVEVMDVDPLSISDDIMDLNPYGTLPTLVDRDLILYESRIIMEYLDERFPHPPLMPVDPVSKASSRLFLHRVDHDWYRLMDLILAGGKQGGKARKELRESLTVTAPVFASKPFFMSTEFSLVDCSLGPLLWRLPQLGVELPGQASAVNEYAKNLFARQSFQDSLTELEEEMRE